MNNFGQTYAGAQCSKEQAEKLAWTNQQTAQGGIGGGGILTNRLAPSPPQTLLNDACERVSARAAQLLQVADRLTSLGDRVFGARPEPGAAAGNQTPSCEAERLAYLLDCLREACDKIEDRLARIEQI